MNENTTKTATSFSFYDPKYFTSRGILNLDKTSKGPIKSFAGMKYPINSPVNTDIKYLISDLPLKIDI